MIDNTISEIPKKAGDRKYLGQVLPNSLAYAIAAIAEKQSGMLVVLVEDSLTVSKLERELSFFLGMTKTMV